MVRLSPLAGRVRLGYACVNTRLPSASRTVRLKNATPERILELARENLAALDAILEWNREHAISLFRISSETIPFGSHPVNTVPWWDELEAELQSVGRSLREHGVRASMHPGQFTVLNSNREEVVKNSVAELEYHGRLFDSFGLDSEHKIIIHLGGVYGDKAESMRRFEQHFSLLSGPVRSRLVIENDERSYSLEDALTVSDAIGVPVVFDVFHHRWNPSLESQSLEELIQRAAGTWGAADGRPKLHYSDQAEGRPPGTHSESLDLEAFAEFYRLIEGSALDVMLEVKDKERSLLAGREQLGLEPAQA